ncbi:hypothetical protein D8B24_17680 [Verminephrobacter aporrectodeae subsp. tuberculatae]|uniref:thiolase family protein n=1 Tax=Verminephrobacter aporrectodeae TaxID=1110389 RepID=UPI00224451B7|nr:hypothetical protein [Verminephrobacter aporrectodeae]MCW8208809.1 hypothetical protein [Verminephrobacter aporrectodeae subsp. tuberculatae]
MRLWPGHHRRRDQLASLRPVFDKVGSVAAGKPGINDGAAVALVMRTNRTQRRVWQPWPGTRGHEARASPCKKARASVFSFTRRPDFFGRVWGCETPTKEESHEPESCVCHGRHGRYRDRHMPAPAQGGLQGHCRLRPDA